jgi:hypothetical protein
MYMYACSEARDAVLLLCELSAIYTILTSKIWLEIDAHCYREPDDEWRWGVIEVWEKGSSETVWDDVTIRVPYSDDEISSLALFVAFAFKLLDPTEMMIPLSFHPIQILLVGYSMTKHSKYSVCECTRWFWGGDG